MLPRTSETIERADIGGCLLASDTIGNEEVVA
jgi:hypothetical protein